VNFKDVLSYELAPIPTALFDEHTSHNLFLGDLKKITIKGEDPRPQKPVVNAVLELLLQF
jgi:hypothetical protein